MLTGDRDPGPTFAPDDIGFIDFESKSQSNLAIAGTYRYARTVDALVLAYAIGDAPVRVVERGGQPLHWNDLPIEVRAHHDRVMAGKATWAAWNAGFDKAIWNYSTIGFPLLQPCHIIDVMAQAVNSGLPSDLPAPRGRPPACARTPRAATSSSCSANPRPSVIRKPIRTPGGLSAAMRRATSSPCGRSSWAPDNYPWRSGVNTGPWKRSTNAASE
jgi:hypothetical protein